MDQSGFQIMLIIKTIHQTNHFGINGLSFDQAIKARLSMINFTMNQLSNIATNLENDNALDIIISKILRHLSK